jgi:hypothetical protein
MTCSTPRHLLVIATQCPAQPRIDRLERAADTLFGVLTEPDVGAAKGTLLAGSASKTEVETAVTQAIVRAAAEGAVLVLAFLGHGFTLPNRAALYYMAGNTKLDEPTSGVEVGRLLSEAVQQPGIAGVIGLVDTCHAAGAIPDMRLVVGGVGEGRTGLGVLMASAADQRAYRMDFTFALTDLLRAGIPDAAEVLYIDDPLVGRLREKVGSQTPARLTYDGGAPSTALWLARNYGGFTGGAIGSVGALGQEELAVAIRAWDGECAAPGGWTRRALRELGERAARSGTAGSQYVVHVVDALNQAVRAAEFIRDELAATLTTAMLRAAARRAGLSSWMGTSGSMLLVFLLEDAALRVARVGRSPWEPLAKFVAALAIETGIARDHLGLRRWARECGLDTEVNDAFAALVASPDRADLRLVLSLADGFTGWPDTVDAWLLRPGETPTPQESFRCTLTGRPGTENAVRCALDWAVGAIQPGETLCWVDIAVPAHLLADWRPEETDTGQYVLGFEHNVLTQWSGRLQPNTMQLRMNESARRMMREMAEDTDVPLDWITQVDLRDVHALNRKLKTGLFRRAIGLDHRPADLADVLELLLPYSPVLLWPGPDEDSAGTWPDAVRDNWHVLPHEFAKAFREWSQGHATALGCVRSVWHDVGWLEFCRRFERRTVQTP